MKDVKFICSDCGNDTFNYYIPLNDDGSRGKGHYVECVNCGSTGARKPSEVEDDG